MCKAEERQLTKAERQEVSEIRDALLRSVRRLDPDPVPDFSKWYAGITSNVVRRFVEHGLSEEKTDLYDYEVTSSRTVAQAVEKVFLDVYGMEGGPKGTEGDANMAYIYKKAPHTVP